MTRGIYRFGAFELDCERVELRKAGIRVCLQEQPFRILRLLLSAEGSVVTREEIRRALWPDDTFVEFDHGLNAAVNKVRETLGDNAANPRFVETLPRRGYRFIAPVQILSAPIPIADIQPGRGQARLPRQTVWAAMLAVVVAALILSFGRLSRRAQPGLNDPSPKLLTTYRGREYCPTFSPDGDRIAFAWARADGHDFDIYVKQVGSEQPHRLTTDSDDDLQPAWSPDGRTIAYLRSTSTTTAAIMLMSAVGGPAHKIGDLYSTASDALLDRLLTWLPDSRQLIVSDRITPEGPRALFRVSVLTGERLQITVPETGADGDDGPDLSPDRSTLVFVRSKNAISSELFLLPLSSDFTPSGEPKRITFLERLSGDPLWTNDGRELLFVSGPEHARRFFRMRPSASDKPRPVLPVAELCSGIVSLSPAKKRLAYTRSNWDVNIWKLNLASSAARPRSLIHSTSADRLPVISPDGGRIAFVTNRSGANELWVSRADGSDSELLVPFDGDVGFVDWSPDGKLIAFAGERRGSESIFTVSSNGGRATQLTPGSAPSWSHDGKGLYFASSRDGEMHIWKMSGVPEAPSQPVRVTRREGHRALESPDGKYLFYVSGMEPSRLFRLSLDGSGEELAVGTVSNVANFAVSSTGVYFIPPEGADKRAVIQSRLFSSHGSTTIGRSEKPVAWGTDVSPDGRWLLFAQRDREEADLMLVEELR